jgi:hypothetical protein
MQEFTQAALQRMDDIANRNGVSRDAVATLLRAVANGGGGMAQFSHPELGGMGQWSQGGMIMVGDMFNQGLKHRVDSLCNEVAGLLREMNPFVARPVGTDGQGFGGNWWPAELGSPSSSGGQNDMRYAYFPGARRLAVQFGGILRLYDTGRYQILGVSQQQGTDRSLTFSSDWGTVRLGDLVQLDAHGAPLQQPPLSPPAPASHAPEPHHAAPPPANGGNPLAMIEQLAALRQKGILTDEEFTAKKAELLSRL